MYTKRQNMSIIKLADKNTEVSLVRYSKVKADITKIVSSKKKRNPPITYSLPTYISIV